jgi:riboflavin biosynthesis pyrimidine reductase
MEIDMTVTANTVAAVEVYLAAKAQAEQAAAILEQAKKDVIAIVGGYGFLAGETADLDVAVQARKTLDQKGLLQFITQDQLNSCMVEGAAYPVVRIKAKKVAKAA